LFVAVDAIGTLPFLIGIIEGVEQKRLNRMILLSVLTAMVVAFAFLFVGEGILRSLGITVEDFLVAGGIVLFLLSLNDLLAVEKHKRLIDAESLGPVPLGVPLIVGPAVLTTIMLLVREYGFTMTAIATVINVLIAGVIFIFARFIMRLLGDAGTRITSKVASLLLAAIAVMMVRKGIYAFIHNWK
jgi:multiple antibiotic resistance protein